MSDEALRARALELVTLAATRPRVWRARAAVLLGAAALIALARCAIE